MGVRLDDRRRKCAVCCRPMWWSLIVCVPCCVREFRKTLAEPSTGFAAERSGDSAAPDRDFFTGPGASSVEDLPVGRSSLVTGPVSPRGRSLRRGRAPENAKGPSLHPSPENATSPDHRKAYHMSHATVLVIGDDVEMQMAPYDEGLRVDRYKDRVTLSPDAWPGSVIAKEAPEVDLLDAAACAAWLNGRWGDDERHEVDEEGLFTWSTYNPISKWDWWVVGGRWRGQFILKAGASGESGRPGTFDNGPMRPGGVDRARKGDIDWDQMRKFKIRETEDRWMAVHAAVAKGEPIEAARHWHGGFNPEDTPESTVARWEFAAVPLSTHAVLAEGVWREVGAMGWFGCSSDDEGDRMSWDVWLDQFLAGLPDQAVMTIVDYHI